VYVSAIAGVIHYYWLVKSDIRLPAMYGAFVGVLLGYRAIVWTMNRRPRVTSKHTVGVAS
jgi:sulfoxide reductase heme-binding subunit YedZ